jgi:hypothetical protein
VASLLYFRQRRLQKTVLRYAIAAPENTSSLDSGSGKFRL